MSNEEILTAVRDHLSARGIESSDIKPEAHLLRDLDLDSLDLVELTVGIEERLSIEIPDEELEGVETINDVVVLISRKQPVGS